MTDWADKRANSISHRGYVGGDVCVSKSSIAQAIREAVAAERDRTLPALKSAREAMVSWACVHAPDMCGADELEEARRRLTEAGTLAYIAEVTGKIAQAIRKQHD